MKYYAWAPMKKPIPIIDLFAGPGGLGEGFSSIHGADDKPVFQIKLSIEKDPVAHKTLTLRAFFRQFSKGKAPDEYYQYLRGDITREELFEGYPKQAKEAMEEAQCLTLGKDDVKGLIDERLSGIGNKPWVLIGGPPCQAYSLVGRATMSGKGMRRDDETKAEYERRAAEKKAKFESDHRHTLYLEYLKIIGDHWPSIFVMENVKGILSSKFEGKSIFPEILKDLEDPSRACKVKGKKYKYQLRSFVVGDSGELFSELGHKDYLIKAEKYGVPQRRHRVILLGVREDFNADAKKLLLEKDELNLEDIIGDLPKLTGGLSKGDFANPYEALVSIKDEAWWPKLVREDKVFQKMEQNLKSCLKREKRGVRYVAKGKKHNQTRQLQEWYSDNRLKGFCNHETRSHIREDLWRYFYSACYAQVHKRSPHLRDYPAPLLPKHKNVDDAVSGSKFGDRFRTQTREGAATTVISHISKDGHYFIHYDPKQYRSLTVREAARIQTFPDNYFFEGPRTQQYHQVGNAVPPYLAFQLAEVVSKLIR